MNVTQTLEELRLRKGTHVAVLQPAQTETAFAGEGAAKQVPWSTCTLKDVSPAREIFIRCGKTERHGSDGHE